MTQQCIVIAPTLLDQATVAALTSEQRVLRALAGWVGSMRWQLYVVATYARPPRPETVQRTTERWVTDFQRDFPGAFVYVSADRGKVDQRWNVHGLIGGLFSGKPPREPFRRWALQRALSIAQHCWRHGDVVKSQPYDARRGAVTYLARYWFDAEVPPTLYGRPLRRSHARP